MWPRCAICFSVFCIKLASWAKIPASKILCSYFTPSQNPPASAQRSSQVTVHRAKDDAWERAFAASQCAFLFKSQSPAAAAAASLPHCGWSCVLQLKVVVMGTSRACRRGLMCLKSWAKATSDREWATGVCEIKGAPVDWETNGDQCADSLWWWCSHCQLLHSYFDFVFLHCE